MNPDEARMTFSEHLEELRSCIIRALLGVGAFAVVALCFQSTLFQFFAQPYERARAEIRLERGKARTGADPSTLDGTTSLTEATSRRDLAALAVARQSRQLEAQRDVVTSQSVALSEVVRALREESSLDEDAAAGLEAALVEGRELLAAQPGFTDDEWALLVGHDIGPLQSVHMTEVFMSHIKVALLTAALFAAPWILFQLWQFVGAGLYPHERKVILKVFPFSVGLFGIGLVFGFFVLVPVSVHFLLNYGDPEVIAPAITVGSYLGLLFVMLFVMGLVFQIPLLMTVVSSLGLIDPKLFRTKRKFFLMGAVVMAAVLTPPDYVTQILVAIPMVVLYEFGVVLATVAARRRKQRLETGDPASEETA